MRPEILKWVRIVVLKTVREKRLTHLDVDELISCGFFGYSQCLKRYDPARGVKFKTYAEHRIRGAVLDEVRKMIGDERCKNKRPKRNYDYDMAMIGDMGSIISEIDSKLDLSEFFKTVPLSDKEKEILQARAEGHNLREIGKKFGFSESRASQLLAEIKGHIFPWLENYTGVEFRLTKRKCNSCGIVNIFSEGSAFECEGCNEKI